MLRQLAGGQGKAADQGHERVAPARERGDDRFPPRPLRRQFAAGDDRFVEETGKERAIACVEGYDAAGLNGNRQPIETMSGEAASRAHPELPGIQRTLAEVVLDLGKPVVALITSGRPLIAPWLMERAAAVLATWFLGHEAGHAIADVLTGISNPSGRLPVSWPRDVGQIPIFHAERPTGRPADPANRFTSKYLDVPTTPQFPFGHGLSYSRFTLSGLRATRSDMRPDQRIEIAVDVTNKGLVAGEETVLLFIHDLVASVARPVLELKDFAKISLEPGERGTVRFSLTSEAFTFLGRDLAPVLETGDIELFVGRSADRDSLLRTSVRIIAD